MVSTELSLTFLLGSEASLVSLALLASSRVASSTVFLISLKGDRSLDATLLTKFTGRTDWTEVEVRAGVESLLTKLLVTLFTTVLLTKPPISPFIAVFTQLFGNECFAE